MRPENIVWQFGSGRTGSTWLSSMMRRLPGFGFWGEPAVGKLFGDLYTWKGARERANNPHFVMPAERPDLWREPVRAFVLKSIELRAPEAEYFYVCEPNGAAGAAPLLKAFPESRLVFLLRDPRDVVASYLDGSRGGWQDRGRPLDELATTDPDRFVEARAAIVHKSFVLSWRAFSEHEGPKTRVRYEDLRADTPGTLQKLLARLGLPGERSEIERIAEAQRFENLNQPKGPGMKRRKATPGSWREDLTPAQARTVEEICRPILKAFY